MSTTLDSLAAGLKRFFARQFPVSTEDGAPGSVLLVFDGLGRPLSAAEFADNDPSTLANPIAQQRAADLADQLPAVNALAEGWYLPRSGSRLSLWYANLLEGSSAAADAMPEVVGAFEAAKSGARRKLELNRLAAGSGGAAPTGVVDAYYATSMSPPDWYVDGAANWQVYDVQATDDPLPAPPRGEGGREGPMHPGVLISLAAPHLLVESAFLRLATRTEPPLPAARLTLARTPSVQERVGVGLRTARLDDQVVARHRLDHDEVVDLRVDAEAVATFAAATERVPSTSERFSVRFEYCLVRFDRPWWDDVFVNLGGWRAAGWGAGQISSGSAASPAANVTLMTVGMLVVRDLTMSAKWSGADIAALPRTTSVGPFCVAAGGFDTSTGTLSRKGLQAIAWLCQVPPVLPPA